MPLANTAASIQQALAAREDRKVQRRGQSLQAALGIGGIGLSALSEGGRFFNALKDRAARAEALEQTLGHRQQEGEKTRRHERSLARARRALDLSLARISGGQAQKRLETQIAGQKDIASGRLELDRELGLLEMDLRSQLPAIKGEEDRKTLFSQFSQTEDLEELRSLLKRIEKIEGLDAETKAKAALLDKETGLLIQKQKPFLDIEGRKVDIQERQLDATSALKAAEGQRAFRQELLKSLLAARDAGLLSGEEFELALSTPPTEPLPSSSQQAIDAFNLATAISGLPGDFEGQTPAALASLREEALFNLLQEARTQGTTGQLRALVSEIIEAGGPIEDRLPPARGPLSAFFGEPTAKRGVREFILRRAGPFSRGEVPTLFDLEAAMKTIPLDTAETARDIEILRRMIGDRDLR